jgi:hypothetical protein
MTTGVVWWDAKNLEFLERIHGRTHGCKGSLLKVRKE